MSVAYSFLPDCYVIRAYQNNRTVFGQLIANSRLSIAGGDILNDHPFYTPPVLSGTGFEEMIGSFSTSVPPFRAERESRRGEEFRWWSSVVASEDLVLLRKACTGDWRAERVNEPDMEGLLIVIPTSGGQAEAQVGGAKIVASVNHAIIAAEPRLQSLAARSRPQLSTVSLIFQEAAVKRVLSSMYEGAVLSKLELAPLFDLSSGPGRTFKLLVDTIISGMQGERVLEKSPKSMVLLTEAALRFIFENVPHRFSYRTRHDFLSIAPRHVRAAADFMHANMHRSITVTEIAEEVGVSVRSLQMGFEQFWNTTPSAYLRSVRLEAVHVELSAPENRLPIKEVALKWGFANLGRFAQQYRSAYSVHPSETVKRAQLR